MELIDTKMLNFFQIISAKSGITIDELVEIYSLSFPKESASSRPTIIKLKENISYTDYNLDELSQMSVKDLSAICKTKGLKQSGKKIEVIARILNLPLEDLEKTGIPVKKKVGASTTVSALPPPVAQRIKPPPKGVPRQLINTKTSEFKKSVDGLLYHIGTDLVASPDTEKIIRTKTYNYLTPADVEECEKHTLQYDVTCVRLDNEIVEEGEEDKTGFDDLDDLDDDQNIDEPPI